MRMIKNTDFSIALFQGIGLFVSITVSLFILGCASGGGTPVESRAQPPSRKINTHIVERGDTLYSIAWRYETNYKKLAAINGIRPPYVIHKGQKIKLSGSLPQVSNTRSDSSGSTAGVTSAPTSAPTRAVPGRSTSVVSSPTAASPATGSPGTDSKTPAPSAAVLPASVQGWHWPLDGKVVKSFGSSDLTRGITIDSSTEKDVKAAAEGIVVYSGSGVRGYGNFLILKHSDLYLSAYAYNSKILAQEGDQVRKGQRIATAGKDVDGEPRLYFEIRKDGKPVDPIRYLPRR